MTVSVVASRVPSQHERVSRLSRRAVDAGLSSSSLACKRGTFSLEYHPLIASSNLLGLSATLFVMRVVPDRERQYAVGPHTIVMRSRVTDA